MKSLQSAYFKVPTFVTLVRFLSLSGLLISIAPPNHNICESVNLKLYIPQTKLLILSHLEGFSTHNLPYLGCWHLHLLVAQNKDIGVTFDYF